MTESIRLVRPEHLNHHGDLFGGRLLEWVDEHAYIGARRDFPGRRFVTVAMDRVVFHAAVGNGDLLRLTAIRSHLGRSSVRYAVSVHASGEDGNEREVFGTEVTLVAVDDRGQPTAIV